MKDFDFGNFIYSLRKGLKLSQKELAEFLNTKHQTYGAYEKGINEPNIKTLIKLADYYNVSVDYLIGRTWHNDIGYLTPQQVECVNFIKQLNETNIIKLMGYLSAMVSMQ